MKFHDLSESELVALARRVTALAMEESSDQHNHFSEIAKQLELGLSPTKSLGPSVLNAALSFSLSTSEYELLGRQAARRAEPMTTACPIQLIEAAYDELKSCLRQAWIRGYRLMAENLVTHPTVSKAPKPDYHMLGVTLSPIFKNQLSSAKSRYEGIEERVLESLARAAETAARKKKTSNEQAEYLEGGTTPEGVIHYQIQDDHITANRLELKNWGLNL